MRLFPAALVALSATACGPPPPPPPPTVAAKFSDIQAKVFAQSCGTSSCHDGATPQANLKLVGPTAFGNLVGAAPFNDVAKSEGKLRVDPGHPENSFLLLKIESAPLDHKYGVKMPQVGDPVSAPAVSAIETWIKNGAPDD